MATTVPDLPTSMSNGGVRTRKAPGLWGGEHRTSVSVDESGNTNLQKLSG
jgi:hypothetical protein